MRNRKCKTKIEIERPEKGMATPTSISKHPSTRRSVRDELSSSKQASVVLQSPQAKKELFFLFHAPNRKASKHHGWCNIAAEAMGSAVVRTTRVDQSSTLRRAEPRIRLS